MLTHGIFTPHPPAIIPKIGGEETKKFEKTIQALLTVSLKLKQNPPQTLILLTPHAEIEIDKFVVRVPQSPNFTASFEEFGAERDAKIYARDRLLTAQIIEGIHSRRMQTVILEDEKLDFGSSIPLYFLASALPEIEIVNLGISLAGIPEHQKLGEVIAEISEKSKKQIAFIASGELSHRLAKNSPHGFFPPAAAWEEELIQNLENGDFEKALRQDPFELDEVGECGMRPLAALLGAFEKIPHTHALLSHEAPGGIGCAVGFWERK
ncbi:MAG: AmmeMemoRadiSam system protein B [Patescibacteria group bacterium]